MLSFDNGTILKSSIETMLESTIGTMLESIIGTMLDSSIGTMLGSYVGTMLESSTESVLHFDIIPTPIQCRKPMSFRHWNVGCRRRNDIVPILELHLGRSLDHNIWVEYERSCPSDASKLGENMRQ